MDSLILPIRKAIPQYSPNNNIIFDEQEKINILLHIKKNIEFNIHESCPDITYHFILMGKINRANYIYMPNVVLKTENYISTANGLINIVKMSEHNIENLNDDGQYLVNMCLDFYKYYNEIGSSKNTFVTILGFINNFLGINIHSGLDFYLLNFINNIGFFDIPIDESSQFDNSAINKYLTFIKCNESTKTLKNTYNKYSRHSPYDKNKSYNKYNRHNIYDLYNQYTHHNRYNSYNRYNQYENLYDIYNLHHSKLTKFNLEHIDKCIDKINNSSKIKKNLDRLFSEEIIDKYYDKLGDDILFFYEKIIGIDKLQYYDTLFGTERVKYLINLVGLDKFKKFSKIIGADNLHYVNETLKLDSSEKIFSEAKSFESASCANNSSIEKMSLSNNKSLSCVYLPKEITDKYDYNYKYSINLFNRWLN